MAYKYYDATKPDPAAQNVVEACESMRSNGRALLDQVAGGFAVGWSATPSDATARPAELMLSKGADRLRITQTWGTTGASAGRLVEAVYARSYDAGGTWETIGTQTLNYTSAGQFAGDAWS